MDLNKQETYNTQSAFQKLGCLPAADFFINTMQKMAMVKNGHAKKKVKKPMIYYII
jgi:hypothetical protein